MGARGCAEWEVIPILARSEKHLHGERFMAGSCDDRIQRTMILALAIRHRMERPAISMEVTAYGAALPAAVCEAFEKMIDVIADSRRISRANFDEKAFHGETQMKCDNIG